MRRSSTATKMSLWSLVLTSAVLLAGCVMDGNTRKEANVALSGAQEVPPVSTSARGGGNITIGNDMSVSGRVTTYAIAGMAAHIHVGAPSVNGPIIIPLTRTADDVWSVPAGAKLTEEQYESYKAGNLYVNVHTPAHKGGEIRGQIQRLDWWRM